MKRTLIVAFAIITSPQWASAQSPFSTCPGCNTVNTVRSIPLIGPLLENAIPQQLCWDSGQMIGKTITAAQCQEVVQQRQQEREKKAAAEKAQADAAQAQAEANARVETQARRAAVAKLEAKSVALERQYAYRRASFGALLLAPTRHLGQKISVSGWISINGRAIKLWENGQRWLESRLPIPDRPTSVTVIIHPDADSVVEAMEKIRVGINNGTGQGANVFLMGTIQRCTIGITPDFCLEAERIAW